MNTNEAIFRDAPIVRTIAHMTIPSMIASLITIVYNLADTFFVGQTHDPHQVAAVSFANSPFIMYMAACLIGIGDSTIISILLGEKKSGRRPARFRLLLLRLPHRERGVRRVHICFYGSPYQAAGLQ